MRNISKIVALSLVMSFAISQTTGKLRGTVSSADGQPLAGANVIVDGTTKGAATDGEGKYTRQKRRQKRRPTRTGQPEMTTSRAGRCCRPRLRII